jgi:hypothetical protein
MIIIHPCENKITKIHMNLITNLEHDNNKEAVND